MLRLRVLLTAIGCPGGPSVARALGEAFDVVGVDMNAHASGRYFVDTFYQVPAATDPKYILSLVDICARENIDVLFPQSSAEVLPVATFRRQFEKLGVKVLAAEPEAISVAVDKTETYKAMEGNGVPIPEWYEVCNRDELLAAMMRLGFPNRRIVIKPPVGKGGQGFRVVVPRINRLNLNMRHWPNSQLITMAELMNSLPVKFPRLMVMEYLKGNETSADTFDGYGTVLGFTKIRRDCQMGVHHSHEARYDGQLMDYGRRVVERLGLEYFVNVQFMAGKLLEVNPRISTQFITNGCNLPVAGVKLAMEIGNGAGLHLPDGTRAQYYHDLRSFAGQIEQGDGE